MIFSVFELKSIIKKNATEKNINEGTQYHLSFQTQILLISRCQCRAHRLILRSQSEAGLPEKDAQWHCVSGSH